MPFLWWGAVASTLIWAVAIPFTGGLGTDDIGGFLLGVTVSGVLHVVYMWVLQRGYAAGNLSTVYATARGTGPLISSAAAVLLLGEALAPHAVLGIAAIIAGVVAVGLVDRDKSADAGGTHMNSSTGLTSSPALGIPRRRIDPGIAFGILTGVAIAVYTIWDTHAIRTWSINPVAYMVGCTLIEIPFYTLALRGRVRELATVARQHWPKILIFGVLSPLSYILILFAITIAPVSLVAPIREVSVVLVSLFGALVLREGKAGWRLGAAAVVVGGIVLLAV